MSSGPAARAKWEIEYHIFFAPCFYLFLFLPSESCSGGGGGGILIVTAFLELSHNAAAVARGIIHETRLVVCGIRAHEHKPELLSFSVQKNDNNIIKCTYNININLLLLLCCTTIA